MKLHVFFAPQLIETCAYLIIINTLIFLSRNVHDIDNTADIGNGFQPEGELDCGQGS